VQPDVNDVNEEMNQMRRTWTVVAVLVGLAIANVTARQWPDWRGPSASRVSGETGLPVRWSDTENVAWKASLTGLGISSPIVSKDLVFVTS
jgi:hypothetical protein